MQMRISRFKGSQYFTDSSDTNNKQAVEKREVSATGRDQRNFAKTCLVFFLLLWTTTIASALARAHFPSGKKDSGISGGRRLKRGRNKKFFSILNLYFSALTNNWNNEKLLIKTSTTSRRFPERRNNRNEEGKRRNTVVNGNFLMPVFFFFFSTVPLPPILLPLRTETMKPSSLDLYKNRL